MILKITKIVWGIICLIFVLVPSADFYMALVTPEKYHFGGEGPIADYPNYKTQEIYLTTSAVMIIWFFIGLMLCLFQRKSEKLKYGVAAHIIATFIYGIVVNMVDI